MKKLLVLMLVLGLASMANAALTDYVLYTDGLVLDVVGIAGGSVPGYYITSNATVNIIDPQTPTIYLTPGNLGANTQTSGDLGNALTATMGPTTYGFITALAAPAPDTVDAGMWFTFDIVDVSTAGWTVGQTVATLAILDNMGAPIGSSAVISTVPEPMTIALLGLGGLFLRRRK